MGSKNRSVGQILKRSCLHSRGLIFLSNLLKNDNLDDISVKCDHWFCWVRMKIIRSINFFYIVYTVEVTLLVQLSSNAHNVCLDISIKIDVGLGQKVDD